MGVAGRTVLVVCVSVAAAPAFAAGLGGLTSAKLGAGSASVLECDSNGFSVTYTTASGSVTGVTLGGIADPGCEGGMLSVTLANATGTSIGAGSPQVVPTDGDAVDNSMSVTLTPTPAASAVKSIHVAVTGP